MYGDKLRTYLDIIRHDIAKINESMLRFYKEFIYKSKKNLTYNRNGQSFIYF